MDNDVNTRKWTTFDGGLGHVEKLAALAIRIRRLRFLERVEALENMINIHAKAFRRLPDGETHLAKLRRHVLRLKETS